MSPAVEADLATYCNLVREWGERLNLVSRRDLPRLEERHVRDCLRIAPLAAALPRGEAVDVGAGAGFPGIVLAVADRTRRWRLIEPNRRRAAFLDEAVRILRLDADVFALSAEAAAADGRLGSAHVLATARALAPPPRAFALLLPLVAPLGTAAVFTGRDASVPRDAEMWDEGVAIIRRD